MAEGLDGKLDDDEAPTQVAWDVADERMGSAVGPGDRIDHFEIERRLGRGGMGEVFLARDTKLGRRVAIKLVHARLLAAKQARERFMIEAQATARCSHPHIVTIFAVGEHLKRPYLALEYVTGDTLRERSTQRSLSHAEILRVGGAIAQALAAAHSAGVLHRDLKPDNVLIGSDGRLRVLDFGLARVVAVDGPRALPAAGRQIQGTPEYMAPEQWTDSETSGAVDVWALGCILFELCSGSLPYEEGSIVSQCAAVCSPTPAPSLEEMGDTPAPLSKLVARCLAKDPADRPTAEDVAEALDAILYPHRAALAREQSPFRGLLPFGVEHSDLFFGREAEIDALIERARVAPILPVVGPSGAGKSSLVRAGFIARLREQGRWIVLQLRLGSSPFHALARRLLLRERTSREMSEGGPLLSTGLQVEALAAELRSSPRRLALRLNEMARSEQANVLLFVDQLEELFTLCDEAPEQAAVMEALCTAAEDADDPVRVVFTVRDDFLGRLVTGAQVRNALTQLVVLQALSAAALVETLTRPLALTGYRFEHPKIVDKMVEEVRGEPNCLPLLQFAAHQLWEERDRDAKLLLSASYKRIGGVAGALAKHADGVLDGLPPEEQQLARRLLLRLVTAEKTRKVVPRAQVIEGLGAEAEGVLERLAKARLLSVGRARTAGRERMVELTHEALIRAWDRLSRWIDDSHEELVLLGELSEAARLWEKRGRRAEGLWRDEALLEVERLVSRLNHELPELVGRFVVACRARQTRRVRRVRLATAFTLLCLVIVALVLTHQKREADQQRQLALARAAEAQAQRAEALYEGAKAAFGQGYFLQARAKLRSALELGEQASTAARALWWQLARHPLWFEDQLGAYAYSTAFSPDGTTLATGCQDGTVYLADLATKSTRMLRGYGDPVLALAFSPDGRRLVTGNYDGTLRLWALPSGKLLRRHPKVHQGGMYAAVFRQDGAQLASAGSDGVVRVWDAAAEAVVFELRGHKDRVYSLSYAPGGKALASAGHDGSVRLWEMAARRERAKLLAKGATYTVRFSPDGTRLAAAGADRKLRLYSVASKQLKQTLSAHTDRVISVAFSPDGRRVASAGFDRKVVLWDLAQGQRLAELAGHTGAVYSVDFSPNGKHLASASFDNSVRVWRVAEASVMTQPSGHEGGVRGAVFHPGGQVVASGSSDGTVRLWSLASGKQLHVLRGHSDAIRGIAISPDGALLASCSVDKTIRLWETSTGTQKQLLVGHKGGVRAVTFSPDGATLASASFDSSVRLWDVRSGTRLAILAAHEGAVMTVAFSPDGKQLASGGRDRSVRLWDVATREQQRQRFKVGAVVSGVRFAPDGESIVATSVDGKLHQWSLPRGNHRVRLARSGRVYDAAFSPRGGLLAVASAAHEVLLRDEKDQTLKLSGHRDEVPAVGFDATGELLVSGSEDGTLRTWKLSSRKPYWRAPAMLSQPPRLFTHTGWHRLDAPAAKPAWGELPAAIKGMIEQARFAEQAGSAAVCIHAADGSLLLVDIRGERITHRVAGVVEARGLPGGCLLRTKTEAQFISVDGGTVSLALGKPAHALGGGNDQLFVATADAVLAFDESGKQLTRHTASSVTAIGHTAAGIVVGHRDGQLQLLGSSNLAAGRFEAVASSPVVRIVAGPRGTLAVGYANGEVGLWDAGRGARLLHGRLHGPVVHLLFEAGGLYASSELGQSLRWDLAVLLRERCDLLREIWSQVPVIWAKGRALSRPVPVAHPCYP